MVFNNTWGYGQLFGFSALDGPNRYYEDFILMTLKQDLSFRVEFRPRYMIISFDELKDIKYEAIMSDFVVASTSKGKFIFTFLDNDTLVGVSPCLPNLSGEENNFSSRMDRNVLVFNANNHFIGLVYEKMDNGLFKFVLHNSFSSSEARSGCNRYLANLNVEEILEKRINYYKDLPECKNKEYESLYYKSLSVQKVNIKSPEGKIDDYWTTPDRVPHRHMWMWDSAFHALAMVNYNPSMAQRIFASMVKQTRENGFMPHMANPTDSSDVTQPCVMSYTAYRLYEVTKDKEFLKTIVDILDNYLTFDKSNRDENKNNLLEWFTEPEYKECKCGESGLDNSPRFDFDEKMDCIDFSSYFALDTEYLAKIYNVLGNKEKEKYWSDISNTTKEKINSLMWDEEIKAYSDLLFSNELTHVLTHSSFLPMFANFAKKEYVEKMVNTLKDETLLWTKLPVASISKKDPRFSNDMWRGGVWLNLNYFIIKGLKNYGYDKEADELSSITLKAVNKWYKLTGCIFEFYDPNDEISPFYCHRKGEPTKEPDYRKHVHSISDYNWSACFIMLMIQKIY